MSEDVFPIGKWYSSQQKVVSLLEGIQKSSNPSPLTSELPPKEGDQSVMLQFTTRKEALGLLMAEILRHLGCMKPYK